MAFCGVAVAPATLFRRFAPDASRLKADYRDKEKRASAEKGEGERRGRKIGVGGITEERWRKGRMEANQPSSQLSMHPIMEMRPLAALENYVDVMRDTPSSYTPLDHRFLDLLDFPSPFPILSLSFPYPFPTAPAAARSSGFDLKTVFGLSRIHKIQLSFSPLFLRLLVRPKEFRPPRNGAVSSVDALSQSFRRDVRRSRDALRPNYNPGG